MQQPPQRQSIWRWYRSGHPLMQIGLAFLALFVVLLACSFCTSGVPSFVQGFQQGLKPMTDAQTNVATTNTAEASFSTPPPETTPTPCTDAVNGNPWCYNFDATGTFIYYPPAEFCTYFKCVSDFVDGTGFVVQCHDKTFSKTGGLVTVCDGHGGELQPLYAH